MSHRCTNAFLYDGKVYAGGRQVADDDPILLTHSNHFAKVQDQRGGNETASQNPGEVRTPTSAAADQDAADAAAWLAAEAQHEEDVQAWLLAEEQYHSDVAAWLTAEAEAKAEPESKPRPQSRRSK
ncbi:hypothetical protein [Mycolicibacterium palauense]|uniref:hypothetical protein n=1 Tax=Mycolicibacterium palauense TaxID=2034511 RepID=UPI000BFEF059|nr:hypothetical protein [Mycolicibacterium palauense]